MRKKVIAISACALVIAASGFTIWTYLCNSNPIEFLSNATVCFAGAGIKATKRPPTKPPVKAQQNPVRKLIFVHHSTGENWLADDNGGLGQSLAANRYYVSDTNYGWGPDAIGYGNKIGDNTDIGHWWLWFRSPDSSTYLTALYGATEQNSSYSRLTVAPTGENQIIVIKSCFPNSNLGGSSSDPIPTIQNNELKGESSGTEYHTIANAKGIYIDLLSYFQTQPNKLFIIVTAPPLGRTNTTPQAANNARALNNWLKNNWLASYPLKNVAVFDFYDILTKKGKSNYSEYSTSADDDHPNRAGNREATRDFIPFLKWAVDRWNKTR